MGEQGFRLVIHWGQITWEKLENAQFSYLFLFNLSFSPCHWVRSHKNALRFRHGNENPSAAGSLSARRPPRSRTTKLSNDSGRRKPRSGSAEVWLVPVRTRAPLPLSRATILRFRGPRRESFGIKARPCTHQHALQLANNNKKKRMLVSTDKDRNFI